MADATPPNPKKEDVKEVLVEMFKDSFGFDLNSLLSLGAPEVRQEAEKLADRAKGKMPEGHPLRTKTAERMMSLLTARLEAAAEGQSKTVRAFVENISDFLDVFRGRFYGSPVASGGKASPKPDASKIAEDFGDLRKQFLKDANVLLASAKPDEMEAVQEQLRERARFLGELETLMTEGPKEKEVPKPEPSKEPKEPWSAKWSRFGKWVSDRWTKSTEALRPFNASLDEWIQERQAKKLLRKANEGPSKPDRLGEILESPWKLLLGFGGFWWLAMLGAICICLLGEDRLKKLVSLSFWTNLVALKTILILSAIVLIVLLGKKILNRTARHPQRGRKFHAQGEPNGNGPTIDI